MCEHQQPRKKEEEEFILQRTEQLISGRHSHSLNFIPIFLKVQQTYVVFFAGVCTPWRVRKKERTDRLADFRTTTRSPKRQPQAKLPPPTRWRRTLIWEGPDRVIRPMLALYKSYYRNHCIYKEGQAMLVAKLERTTWKTPQQHPHRWRSTQVNCRKCHNCMDMSKYGWPEEKLSHFLLL